MKKRRVTKRKPAKRAAPKVKVIKVPLDSVVQVVAPQGAVPIVAVDKRTVEIVPVPAARKKSWLESIFG